MTVTSRRQLLAYSFALLAAPFTVEAPPAGRVYEGKNVVLERRYAEGQLDRLPDPALAAKTATASIPIALASVSDPVAVDKILRGAKLADLPVEQPTTFELVINLKTAKALAAAACGSGDRVMNRRAFIAGGFALLAAPLGAEAQPTKTVRIGYLSGNPPSDTRDALAGFRTKLRELGYVEGRNLLIEARYADGRYDRLPDLAADLVRLKVDLIFSYGTPASLAAKNTTKTLPIVFGGVADPLTIGLVATLTRPGANVTGVMSNNPELSAKRLSLLKAAVPGVSRVAALANPDFKPTASMVAETKVAAESLGVELQVVEARTPQEIANAFEAISTARVNGLAVLVDPMFIAQRRRIAELAMKNRIPTIYHLRQFVEAGGLISYGVDYTEAFQQSAVLVDKILKGSRPADLPVEQPWRFPLVINLKTAKALGLTIPPSLLLRADQVIE